MNASARPPAEALPGRAQDRAAAEPAAPAPRAGDDAVARGLERACELALKGHRGANPLVGAVVLDAAGRVLSEGFHLGAGTPHAEVAALSGLPAGALRRAAELTLVVSLEPCRLTGRTPPCVEAILRSGVGRVVFGSADPTPNGGGAARLEGAGVEVLRVDHAGARALNARWFAARAQGRPFVSAHLAQSLDGRVADLTGAGRWITGPEARAHAHEVRARVGAIVVGAGTVLADDPALTVRREGRPHERRRVVVAGTRPLPRGLRLSRRLAPGGDAVQVPGRDPSAVLAAAGADHVLLEGGPTLLAAFAEAGLIDELFLYVAPIWLGPGVDATAALSPRPVSGPLAWAEDPAGSEPSRLGPDLLLHLTPAA